MFHELYLQWCLSLGDSALIMGRTAPPSGTAVAWGDRCKNAQQTMLSTLVSRAALSKERSSGVDSPCEVIGWNKACIVQAVLYW